MGLDLAVVFGGAPRGHDGGYCHGNILVLAALVGTLHAYHVSLSRLILSSLLSS